MRFPFCSIKKASQASIFSTLEMLEFAEKVGAFLTPF
jgi:hypothetical protein